jgi:hypothetical protein
MLKMETRRHKMEAWRVCRPVVAVRSSVSLISQNISRISKMLRIYEIALNYRTEVKQIKCKRLSVQISGLFPIKPLTFAYELNRKSIAGNP